MFDPWVVDGVRYAACLISGLCHGTWVVWARGCLSKNTNKPNQKAQAEAKTEDAKPMFAKDGCLLNWLRVLAPAV